MWTEVIYSYIPIISPCLLVKQFFFAKLLGTKRRSVSMNSARVHPTKSRPLSSRGAWLKRWDRRLNLVKVFWDRTRRISHGWLRFHCHPLPIGSMYAIYGNIYHQYTPNVSIYTIHGSYGIYNYTNFTWTDLPDPTASLAAEHWCGDRVEILEMGQDRNGPAEWGLWHIFDSNHLKISERSTLKETRREKHTLKITQTCGAYLNDRNYMVYFGIVNSVARKWIRNPDENSKWLTLCVHAGRGSLGPVWVCGSHPPKCPCQSTCSISCL